MSFQYSVVIPVYRAVDTLPTLVEQLSSVLGNSLVEIVLVYDCGLKESLAKIKELSLKNPLVKGIELTRNYGQHNATICGFEMAGKSDFIITLDEDLQHFPKDINLLINKQKAEDADVVYGVYTEKNHTFFRNFTSSVLKKLLAIGIPELNADYSSFRLIKTSVAKSTIEMKNSYTFLDGYLTWVTSNVASVQVSHGESQAGNSSYSIKKLIEHSINIFVTFSNLPIRLLSYFSILFFVFSFIYAIFIVVSSMTIKEYDAGFPTLVSMLSFGFGAVLLGLGILGEYIQRINLKTTNRPNYSVKHIHSGRGHNQEKQSSN